MKFSIKELFSPKHRTKTIVALSIVGVAAVAGLSVALFNRPSLANAPKPGSDQKDIGKYLASKEFGQLPVKDRREYLGKLREAGGSDRNQFRQMRDMPAEQRQQLMNNMRPVRMAMEKERLDKFFAMSPEDQEKELDKMAERMKQFRANRQQNNNANASNNQQRPRNNNNNNNRNAGSEQRQRMRYEYTDSDTRAKQAEFHRRLMEKLKKK